MPSELNKAIGETLRMHREDKGVSGASLSRKLDIHKSYISKYEGNTYNIPAEFLVNALLELGIDAQVFCEDVFAAS